MDKPEYKQITAQEAKALMEKGGNYVILDVRDEREFIEKHIKGALLIPGDQIVTRANSELSRKDDLILIYCHSGRRSALAAKKLLRMGYSNVLNFGGIIDWPYETVSENS